MTSPQHPIPPVTLEPSPEQLASLQSTDRDGPVVMLNLLRFREHAIGIDAADNISGAEAYARYGASVLPHLQRVGGRVLLTLPAEQSVVGPDAPEWDLVLVVQYPSRQAFLSMIADPDYLQIHHHRAAALADSRLIACAPPATAVS